MSVIGGLNDLAYAEQMTLSKLPNKNGVRTVFTQSFEIKGNSNVRITAVAPSTFSNSWAELEFDLIDEKNNRVESIPVAFEYYTGVDSDGSWTEGSKTEDATVSSLPEGKYTLRVQGTWGKWQQDLPLTVKVEQNVIRGVNFCLALLALAIFPILSLFRKFAFESKRWSESMFGENFLDI